MAPSILVVVRVTKVKNDHHSKFSNLSNWKEEAGKNQGFNGIQTCDLHDTGAMLYQLSGKFTGMIILHLQPQFTYELFYIYFTVRVTLILT